MTKTTTTTETIVTPSAGRVLVRLLPEESETKSGLYFGNQDEKVAVRRGVVVACGHMLDTHGYEQNITKYQVGDVVLLNRHSGLDMDIDTVRHRIVYLADVIATIRIETVTRPADEKIKA